MSRMALFALIVIGAVAGCARRDSTDDTAPTETPAPARAADAGSTPAETAPGQPATPPADTTSPAGPPIEPGADDVSACDAEPAQRFVNEMYTPELGEEARTAAGASVARALRPGEVVTMEFRVDRLSLTLDETGRITRVSCG